MKTKETKEEEAEGKNKPGQAPWGTEHGPRLGRNVRRLFGEGEGEGGEEKRKEEAWKRGDG